VPDNFERVVAAAERIARSRQASLVAESLDVLRGHEGEGSAAYFGAWSALVPEWAGFAARTRRPPRDPANAVLSFGYTLLTQEAAGAVAACGLEPSFGFLHVDDHKRPSLALDLIEELRPVVVDTAVLTALRGGVLVDSHFRREVDSNAVLLTDEGRRRLLDLYELRMLQTFRHVVAGKVVTYRMGLLLQARQLAAAIRSGVPEYEPVSLRR
jgi:CRISPR-associated protein Cas1